MITAQGRGEMDRLGSCEQDGRDDPQPAGPVERDGKQDRADDVTDDEDHALQRGPRLGVGGRHEGRRRPNADTRLGDRVPGVVLNPERGQAQIRGYEEQSGCR